MLRLITVLVISLFLAGCQNNQGKDFCRFHEDGKAKPVVAMIPIIDSTSFDMSWSLSDEFTSILRKRMSLKDTLFVSQYDETKTISYAQEPFGADISWASSTFDSNEFIVFLEFLEHEIVPDKKYSSSAESLGNEKIAKNLNMSARIRIVDIRNKTPKIILQEVIKDSYFISKNLLQPNYEVSSWGTNEYLATPLSMAHMQFAKNIVERISDYILIAKSR